ncbi:MAG: zinc ribbon domain-containing protein [Chthoniobacterales bacterium]
MTKLVCPDCRHENETERIYCHNCGARLDRTGLAKGKTEEGPTEEKTQQHLKKMFSPNRGRAKHIAVQFVKLLLGALCLAVVIVMLLPPDLPPTPKSYDFAPLINMDMVSALSTRQPATLVYNEEQVNSYLAATLRRKDSPSQQGFFPLKRVFLQFREGQCSVNLERRLMKLSVFIGGTYRVTIANGKIVAESDGGYIGRMPIHHSLMKQADFLFGKAWECLARESNSVSRLAGIEFHPQSVTLIVAR